MCVCTCVDLSWCMAVALPRTLDVILTFKSVSHRLKILGKARKQWHLCWQHQPVSFSAALIPFTALILTHDSGLWMSKATNTAPSYYQPPGDSLPAAPRTHINPVARGPVSSAHPRDTEAVELTSAAIKIPCFKCSPGWVLLLYFFYVGVTLLWCQCW